MFFNFNRKHGFFLAAFAACTVNLCAATITLAPGTSIEAILNVPDGDWIGYGQGSPQFNEQIFTVLPGSNRRYDDGGIRVSCALCSAIDSLPAGDFEWFYWDQYQGEFWANVPRKAASYELVIRNTGELPDQVILQDEGELVQNPEPSTILLIGGGLISLGLLRRKLQLQK